MLDNLQNRWLPNSGNAIIIFSSQCASIVQVPDHRVRADDELGPGVPLVVGDVVVGLQPNPLLPFGEEAVVAGLPLAILHHCRTHTTDQS